MNVSLTSELEKFIQDKVDSKMYQTASEVVREALRVLKQQEENAEKLETLRRDIQIGLDQLERGESRKGDKSLLNEIIANGRRKLEARKGRR